MVEYADENFFGLMDRFDHLMLTTRTPDGAMRSRPMAIAKRRADGVIYLVTGLDTGKIEEIVASPQICATMQGHQRFLSISGKAEIIQDQALLEEIWEPAWSLWFPQGFDDPAVALIKLSPTNGEYWDWSLEQKLRFVWEAGKALITTGKLDTSHVGESNKVAFV